MEILITGVAGFIGSNLAQKLLDTGYNVIGVDNLSHGYERNLYRLRKSDKFHFILGDIGNQALLKDYRADIIVHLASQKIPRYTNALKTLDENYLNLRNIVQKCIKDKSKIIFASSSDVYGKNQDFSFSEDSDLVMGSTTVKRWAYALSKIYCEHYIIANHEEYGMNYTIARFFGSYGPNQNLSWWGGPQSVFITNAILNGPLEIHGDGNQTRTFTYVEDTINAIFQFITSSRSDNEIFNVGPTNDSEISILDLAKLIWTLINGKKSTPKLKFIPYSDFGKYEDVMRRLPDTSKLKKFFNFESLTSLEDGLIRTIAWQREVLRLEPDR